MNKQLENNLKTILPADDTTDQLVDLINLPDVKFDAIYSQLKETFLASFKTSDFQQEMLKNIQIYSSTNQIDIEAERTAVEELINYIKAEDTLSENKKDFLITLLEKSALSTYELLKIPRERVEVKIQLVNPDAKLPVYAHPTDAGADIYSVEDVKINPGDTKIIHTGIKVAIPTGYAIFIYPRSGLSLNTNLRIANSVGVVDSDYRGEVGVIMTNIGKAATETIKKGDKIAQMVITPVPMIKWAETNNLEDTERGEGGFGSTDKS